MIPALSWSVLELVLTLGICPLGYWLCLEQCVYPVVYWFYEVPFLDADSVTVSVTVSVTSSNVCLRSSLLPVWNPHNDFILINVYGLIYRKPGSSQFCIQLKEEIVHVDRSNFCDRLFLSLRSEFVLQPHNSVWWRISFMTSHWLHLGTFIALRTCKKASVTHVSCYCLTHCVLWSTSRKFQFAKPVQQWK